MQSVKKEKRPVENDTSVGIHKKRGFPQRLGKACWLFHSYHRPAGDPSNNDIRKGDTSIEVNKVTFLKWLDRCGERD